MHPILRGGLAGLAGTGLMTAVIAAARASGLLWVPPPAQITGNVMRKTGAGAGAPRPVWLAAHTAYGAICGSAYGLIRPALPASPVAAGLAHGGAVWALSYLGLMPALGLYPWPDDDSRPRAAVMIIAHAVFGIVTAAVDEWLSHHQEDGR